MVPFSEYEIFVLDSGNRRKGQRNPFWTWIFDMQSSLSIVIGKALYHGMITPIIHSDELQCQHWLNSILVQNGIEEREKLRGIKFHINCNFCQNVFLFI